MCEYAGEADKRKIELWYYSQRQMGNRQTHNGWQLGKLVIVEPTIVEPTIVSKLVIVNIVGKLVIVEPAIVEPAIVEPAIEVAIVEAAIIEAAIVEMSNRRNEQSSKGAIVERSNRQTNIRRTKNRRYC